MLVRTVDAKEEVGLLTVAEGLSRIEEATRVVEVANRTGKGESQQPRQRAAPRCSLCNSLSHRAPKCPCLQEMRS